MARLKLVMLAVAVIFACITTARMNADPPPDGVDPFIVVFIDSKTEQALGPFPYDRSILAKAIDKAADSGARAVVLKLFIDKPKSADGDRALAESLRRIKVVLQARLDDSEPAPNLFPDRFRLSANAGSAGSLFTGASGWFPLPALSANAHDIGFVDYRVIDRMPLIERYGDTVVKSLYLCCVELALGERAEIVPGKSIGLGNKTVAIDERGEIGVQYPAKDDLPYISFSDFINTPARPEVKDRIVILAYDSEKFEAVETPAGKIRPHRAFVYALRSIYQQFQ